MRSAWLALCLVLPAAAETLKLDVAGRERTAKLHVPDSAQGPLPLVIALHGMLGTGEQMELMTGFSALADQEGFAVVYPDGLARIWKYGPRENGDDFAFMEALMDRLVKEGTADAGRIYVTGISNGAYFANRLAIEFPDRIAAIAPVAGTFLKLIHKDEESSRPMPVLYIHGTADTIVGYDGKDVFSKSAMSLSAEECVAWWVEQNGAKAEAKVSKLEDRAPDDGTRVERFVHAGGTTGADVFFFKVLDGGHTWPGMTPALERVLGRTCLDFNASETIWAFFRRHSLPGKK